MANVSRLRHFSCHAYSSVDVCFWRWPLPPMHYEPERSLARITRDLVLRRNIEREIFGLLERVSAVAAANAAAGERGEPLSVMTRATKKDLCRPSGRSMRKNS